MNRPGQHRRRRILVGLAYGWIGRPAFPVTAAPEPIAEPAIDAPLGKLVEQEA